MLKKVLPMALAVTAAIVHDAAAQTPSYGYSIQDVLIGADIVQNELGGSTGAGVTFGVIDTGIAAPWIGFSGRVNTALSTCIMANCSKTLAVTDDNGHGTFVASEIIGSVPNAGLMGVAPAGNAIAIKVLNAQGSGLVSDVANGIVTAVNQGAKVLNLSMTFVPTQALINAINYAAAKNAVIVFAGGNSAQAFMGGGNVGGFTDAALKRMFFMGSTNAKEQLSAFSNTPGHGGFVSTSGQFYAYASRWLMADGENIWGASTYHTAELGYSYMTQMSGTSMAAPQAAGAAGLLAARWPFLLNTGQIPQILLQASQDLGAAGVDDTFGAGFLRVDLAFQPIGTLSVPVNGRMVPVSGAEIVSSSALGNMSRLSAVLQRASVYDSFRRDFPASLASITTKTPTSGFSTATAQVMGVTGARSRHLTDLGNGSWLALSFTASDGAPVFAGANRPNPGVITDPTRPLENDWSVALSQRGTYIGVGQGSNAPLSFSDARWGGRTAFFNADADVSGSLLGLATSTGFAAAGFDLGPASRLSIAVTTATDDTLATLTGSGASAHGAALGYTFAVTRHWKVSVTGSFLGEQNMFLGSPSGGYLSLGPSATTTSAGIGSNIDLGQGYQLGFDAVYASTDATRNQNSLIGSTSRLTSFAFAVAFSKSGFLDDSDSLGVVVKKPLRVYGGSASVSVPSGTDLNGNPIINVEKVSLAPTGSETDLGLVYDRPVGAAKMGVSFTVRRDADNIAGATDGAVMLHFKAAF